jgi:hypothetical protein
MTSKYDAVMHRRAFIIAGSASAALGACMRSPSNPAALEDASQRLAYMRTHLHPFWTPMEAGGIFLLAAIDDAINERIFRDLISSVPLTAAGAKAGTPDWGLLATVLAADVSGFLHTATLTPGPYQLDNHHLSYSTDGKLAFDSNGNAPTPISAEPAFTFHVTADHLALLRHLNTRSWQGMIEVIDPKRPYGNSTYYYLDMADALGDALTQNAAGKVEATPEQIGRFQQLHREMLFAVQAFWVHAQ